MRKILIAIIILAAFAACKPEPFKGFIVCKEYTPGHMSNEDAEHIIEAGIMQHYYTYYHRAPHYIEPEWIFYVANRDAVMPFSVDSLTYARHKIGERITMNNK